MWRQLSIPVLCLGLLLGAAHPSVLSAAEGTAQIQVISVDSAEYPDIEVLVEIRDDYGHGVKDLTARHFTLTEDDQTIPSELLEVAPSEALRAPMTIAIVADLSSLLTDEVTTEIRNDVRTLANAVLADKATAAEVALFVRAVIRSINPSMCFPLLLTRKQCSRPSLR